MKWTILSSLSVATALLAGPAAAALIDVRTQDLASNQSSSVVCAHFNSTNVSEDCVSGPSVSSSGATGEAHAYANIATGELKAKANAIAANLSQVSEISSLGDAEIRENVHVTGSGTGTVTAYMTLEGSWSLAAVPPAVLQFQIQGYVALNGGFGGAPANFFVNQSNDSGVGAVNLLLTTTTTVFGNTTLQFDAYLLNQIISATGLIDFDGTAKFMLDASDGFSLSYDDPRFLSNASFIFPSVPEPGTLALIAVGLAALGIARRRAGRT